MAAAPDYLKALISTLLNVCKLILAVLTQLSTQNERDKVCLSVTLSVCPNVYAGALIKVFEK